MKLNSYIADCFLTRKNHSSLLFLFMLICVFSLGMVYTYKVLTQWQQVQGYEAEWIAKSIASGQGFSFDGGHRWLFDVATPDKYYLTAWMAPGFTYIYALCFWLFNDFGRLVILLINVICLSGIGATIFILSEKLHGEIAGISSLALFLLHNGFHGQVLQINDSLMSAWLICATLLMVVSYFERPNFKRSLMIGGALGLTVLTCPVALAFIPIIGVSIFLVSPLTEKRLMFRHAAATMTVALLVIAPWTIRNYLVFNEVVPVRTGLGQITYVGTVALGATVDGGKELGVPAPWRASSYREALRISDSQQERRALERYQMEIFKKAEPSLIDTLNEAQRDAWFRNKTKEFIFTHPIQTLSLAFFKIIKFFRIEGNFGLLIVSLSALSVLIGFRDYRLLILFSLFVGYVVPFSIIVPYWPRYRAPIEPVIMILSGIFIAAVIKYFYNRRCTTLD